MRLPIKVTRGFHGHESKSLTEFPELVKELHQCGLTRIPHTLKGRRKLSKQLKKLANNMRKADQEAP